MPPFPPILATALPLTVAPVSTAVNTVSAAFDAGHSSPDPQPAFRIHSDAWDDLRPVVWCTPYLFTPNEASRLQKAKWAAEEFLSGDVQTGTQAYLRFEERILSALNTEERIALVRHVVSVHLAHPDFEARLWGLRFLYLCRKSKSHLTTPLLEELAAAAVAKLNDDHHKVRKMAVNVLEGFVREMAPEIRASFVYRLTERFADSSPEVRLWAIHRAADTLWNLTSEEQIEVLLKMRAALKDEDPGVVAAAVSAFGQVFRAGPFQGFEGLFPDEKEFCARHVAAEKEKWRQHHEAQRASRRQWHYEAHETEEPQPRPSSTRRAASAALQPWLDVLGLQLSQVETEKDVKKACWKAASLWHPDKHGNSLEAKRRFEEIIQAYASICAELGFKTSFRT